MNKLVMIFVFPLMFLRTVYKAIFNPSKAEQVQQRVGATLTHETYLVKEVPTANGSYVVSPKIPEDGKVPAGTILTIKATPSPGYGLDAVYYTLNGGMGGMTNYENFTPEMKIKIDQDMSVGSTFVESMLIENIKVVQDVVYAQPGVKPLKYDVYTPKGAVKLPSIVIIHGGGWSSNNEDIMRGLARELVKGGQYVVFSIDYRWIKKLDGDTEPNHMHELIEDVFGAIAHIQEHAAEYGADPTRMAVTGDSAGGHLSESAAVLSPYIGDGGFGEQEGVYEFMPSYIPSDKSLDRIKKEILSAIKVVAPSYGPSEASYFKMFLEQTDQGYWEGISPIRHVPDVRERALPHFIVRGSEDTLITHGIVQSYVDVLKAKGQRVNYIQVKGAGHAFFDWKPDEGTIATFTKYGVPHAAKMKTFFNEVFY